MLEKPSIHRTLIGVGAAALVLLAACGETPKSPGAVNRVGTTQGAPGDSGPPTHGILASGGGSGAGGELYVLNPITGQQLWSETGYNGDAQPWVEGGLSCPCMEGITEGAWANTSPWSDEAVSPDLSRVAAVPDEDWNGPAGHVGWIDLLTGAVTDVTAFSASTALGASADTDSYPLFDPKDNSFWFVRNGTDVMRVLDGGTQPMKVGTIPDGDSFVISRTGTLVDIPSATDSLGDVQVGISFGLPLKTNPDGTEFSTYSSNGILELGPTGRGPWTPSSVAGLGPPDTGDPAYATWLTDTLLLAPLKSGAVDLLTYTPSAPTVTAATLLSSPLPDVGGGGAPASPTFTISPDGKNSRFPGQHGGRRPGIV